MFQIEKRICTQQLIQLSITAGLALLLTVFISGSATAAGGSWGGSGGFGSGGGSWGGSGGSVGASAGSTGSGGGLFGGRRPIRDFLGRIGSRLSGGSGGSGGSMGSRGGLFAGSRGGSLGGSSTGGSGGSWGGSTGGGYTGASYGSWGSASAGLSLASFSSTPSYDIASVSPAIYAAPSYDSMANFGTSNFVDSTSFTSPGIAGCASCAAGVGVPFEQGVSTGMSETSYSSDTGVYDGSMPNYDGGIPIDGSVPMDGMPVDGMPIDSSYDPGSAAPTDYYDSGNSLLDDGSSPSPPLPGPSGDDSAKRSMKPSAMQAQRQQKTAAILSVSLPADAEVYINGKRTKTEGAVRNYISRRLKDGQSYPYQVKAVVNRNGKRLVRTGTVAMTAGVTRALQLDFDSPVTTTLAVKVPKDATVRLCGADTAAQGTRRFFETDKLADGESWKDYQIEVTVERDGKDIVIRQSLTLNAGETREVAFDFNDTTGQLVASM